MRHKLLLDAHSRTSRRSQGEAGRSPSVLPYCSGNARRVMALYSSTQSATEMHNRNESLSCSVESRWPGLNHGTPHGQVADLVGGGPLVPRRRERDQVEVVGQQRRVDTDGARGR